MIIIIDGKEYPCKAETSKTQAGKDVVRIISDVAPLAENGFTLVEGDVILNREEYKYLYREENFVREYTSEPEEMIPTKGYVYDIPVNPIQSQINSLNKRVSDITPYIQTKKAYPNEIEKVFYGVPKGNLSIFFDNFGGEYTVNRVEDRVQIKFSERLAEITTITIQVQ